jgi:hypothetical protein
VNAESYSSTDLPPGVAPMSGRWIAVLSGESALAFPQRAGRRLFALMPSPWRCKFCNAPFRGPYAGTMKRIGYTPSRKNPHICARCIERAPEGGAIVPVTILFADVRGYTSLCEQLAPTEVSEFVNSFYQTASSALLAHEGLLGQIAGDEVEGLFVPGLAGPQYRQKAVEASGTPTRRQERSRSGSESRAARSSSATSPAAGTRISRRSATSRTRRPGSPRRRATARSSSTRRPIAAWHARIRTHSTSGSCSKASRTPSTRT